MSNAPMIKAPNTIPNTAAIPNPRTSEGPIAQKREKKIIRICLPNLFPSQ